MRLLISFARRYPKQCLIVFACLVLAGVAEGFGLSTLLPLLSLATNEGAAADPSPAERMLIGVFGAFGAEPSLAAMLVIIVLGMTLKAGLTLLTYRQVGYTVAHMATDLRLSLLAALSASRWEYFTRQRAGGMANAVATEATKSAQGFYEGAVMIALCIQSLVYLVVALLVNWQAALAASGVGVGIFFVLRALVRMARRAGVRQQRYFRSLLARLTDSLQSVKPLKSMARETQMDRLLEHDTRKLNKALRKEVFSAEALKAAQDLLVTLALVAGIYVLLVQWGMALSAVMVLTLVLARMLSSLGNIQKRYQKLAVSEAFYWSLRASIEEAEAQREHGGGEQRPTLDTGIRLRGVRFGYQARPVLDGIDLEIPAGRFTALIGSSGSGKTTLVDLVVGLLRPSAGEIRIDEAPFGRLDLRRWRRMIGYVPQDTVLLHDDVLNNVTLGDPELSEADAVSALKQADAWEFVRSLEDGIHTVVGERGGRLSGGQRQRVLIARALAHRPKLLILDEATSALDPDTEQSIARTLARLRGELTLLAVSHQSALTRAADVVYRIDNGKAVRLSEPPARPVAAS